MSSYIYFHYLYIIITIFIINNTIISSRISIIIIFGKDFFLYIYILVLLNYMMMIMILTMMRLDKYNNWVLQAFFGL